MSHHSRPLSLSPREFSCSSLSSHVIIRTTVIDTGVGILPELHGKLFKPFIQGPSSSSGEGTRGTGLGLAISKRLCRSCNFKSEVGRGSEFWFDLEVETVASTSVEPEPTPAEEKDDMTLFDLTTFSEPKKEDGFLTDKTVLIVDDSDISQKFTVKALERMGCRSIRQAKNGIAAIEKCAQEKIDVIIMDQHMPNMSGLEATRVIHVSHPEVRIIGLSGDDSQENAKNWVVAGASKVLKKPATQQILMPVLKEVLKIPT